MFLLWCAWMFLYSRGTYFAEMMKNDIIITIMLSGKHEKSFMRQSIKEFKLCPGALRANNLVKQLISHAKSSQLAFFRRTGFEDLVHDDHKHLKCLLLITVFSLAVLQFHV